MPEDAQAIKLRADKKKSADSRRTETGRDERERTDCV